MLDGALTSTRLFAPALTGPAPALHATAVPSSAIAGPLAAAAGWLALLLVPALIAIALLGRKGTRSLLRATHYRMGYAVAALAFVHTTATMYTPAIRHANRAGLRLATAALLLILAQLLIGTLLRRENGADDRKGKAGLLRRIHHWLMYATVAAVVSHVALN